MANWSYVWQTNQKPTSYCGPSICVPVNQSSITPQSESLLTNLDTSISTMGQAISHYGEQLRRRRGVQYCHSAGSGESNFTWTMPDAVVTVNASSTISLTYVKGSDSGSQSFMNIEQALTWLVDILK
jgi:hypothetical protein